jgi:tight adherence protein B
MSRVIFVALVVAALALAEAVYYGVRFLGERKGDELKRRLRTLGEGGAGVQILRQRRFSSSALLNELMSGFDSLDRLEKLLDQTDLELSVAQLLGLCVAGAFGGVLLGLFLRNPLLTLIASPALGAVPFLIVMNARSRRAQRISEQLPDALDMMARAIKAGHALPSSFKLVAQECPTPIAVEFAKAYEQQNLGIAFEASVVNMTERVPQNLDLKLFAVSVVIQKETGGNLVEVLENIANTMRERFKFYSKLRALTAEGRLSGIILGALPFVVAFLVALGNPDYIAELGRGLGRIILAGGVVLWVVGVLWIRSLMEVDY